MTAAPSAAQQWHVRSAATRRSRSERRIVLAASELFDELGYDATTLDAVAHRAGIGVATIYNRFGSKANLAAAVVGERLPPLADAAAKELTSSLAIRQVVAGHLLRLATFVRSCGDLFEAAYNAVLQAPPADPRMSKDGFEADDPRHHISFSSLLEPLLAEGQRRGEIRREVEVHDMAGMIDHVLFLRLRTRSEPLKKSVEWVTDLIFDGITSGG